MNRINECIYDEPFRKSRTRVLKEKFENLQARLRELEGESSYTPQGTSPLSLTDSSGGGDSLVEPIVSLSAEMHNTLYVVRPQKKH